MKKSNKKIIVIDDEKEIISIIQYAILEFFEKADTALNYNDALEKLKSKRYDCIVLDIKINDKNGAEIVKCIQENPDSKNYNTPIIIISGFIDFDFIGKFKEKFFKILAKPFEMDNLLSYIKTATSFYREFGIDITTRFDLPFKVHELSETVKLIVEVAGKNPRLNSLFKDLEINRDRSSYLRTHTGLSINIGVSLAKSLQWENEKTYKKIIFASLMKDISLMSRPEIIQITRLVDVLRHPESSDILNHPTICSEVCSEYTEIPTDVITMVLQHHEMPDGSGFPAGISESRISPLSSLLIISNDLADYIIDNINWNINDYISLAKEKFHGSHFDKMLNQLHKIKR